MRFWPLIVLAGCSDAPVGLDAPPAGPSPSLDMIDPTLNALAAAACIDEPDCVRGLGRHVRGLRTDLRDGRVAIALAEVDGCIEALLSAGGPSEGALFIDDLGPRAIPSACRGLWIPRASPGDACASDFSCIDGFCRRGEGSQCGVCRARLTVGETCSRFEPVERECAAGLLCDPASDGPTCVAPITVGRAEACGLTRVCEPGSWCGDDFGLLFCHPSARLGEPCGPEANCAEGVCLPNGICGRRQRGESCSGDDGECEPGLFCGEGLRCTPTFAGSGCDPFVEGSCGDGLHCRLGSHLGRCQTPAEAARPCTGLAACPSLSVCDRETLQRCVRYAAVGAACDPSSRDELCVPGSACAEGRCRIPREPPPLAECRR